MAADILFLGDTSLDTAASYLAGCLTHHGYEFDYVASDKALTATDAEPIRKLFIISDYSARQISPELQQAMANQVDAGAGLLMIGGWESYCGSDGNWAGTILGDLMPVVISTEDDRQNCDGATIPVPITQHAITANLPWSTRAPLIGGYSRVTVKPNGTELMSVQRNRISMSSNAAGCFVPELHPDGTDPFLVIGTHGTGRCAALTTDLAPHWIGPMVDWGTKRIAAQAPGAESVEVGDLYVQFVGQLIRWTRSES